MPCRVEWANLAQLDLEEIWDFTEERWGEKQADTYLTKIRNAVGDDRIRKLRSRQVDFVRSGLKKMREARHFIYFRESAEAILVVRVLHDSMDATLHLA